MRAAHRSGLAMGALLLVRPCGQAAKEHVDAPAPASTPSALANMEPVLAPPRASSDAQSSPACPASMLLVEGSYCLSSEQRCLEWLDPEAKGRARTRCLRFAPSLCAGPRELLHFCIDRDEFEREGERRAAGHVTFTEASSLCAARGKRLCQEAEWTFACEGEEALPYPYGNTRDAGRCNHDRADVLDRRKRLRDLRAPAGQYARCTSPFGARDMVGNVDEWVVRTEEGHERAILKGGWWLAGRNRCRPATTEHGKTYAGVQTGFRCCRDAGALTTAP